MNLTDRDRRLLQELYRRGWTPTAQVREAFFPGDRDGRRTRKRLAALHRAGLVRKRMTLVGPRWDRSVSGAWRLTMEGVQRIETASMAPADEA